VCLRRQINMERRSVATTSSGLSYDLTQSTALLCGEFTLLFSAEAAEDGQVGASAAGHGDAGAARGRQSRASLLSAVFHLRRAGRRALRTHRSVPFSFKLK